MRRTILDIMLKVAELGLLRANKDELKRIEDYMDDWCEAEGLGYYKITDNGIFIQAYDYKQVDGVFVEEVKDEDITYQVLKAIYGTR